jgi:hypothetical protein
MILFKAARTGGGARASPCDRFVHMGDAHD